MIHQKPLKCTIKGDEAISKNHSTIRNQSKKILCKTSLKFKKKKKKEENTVKDPEIDTKGYTWIQRDSNFISLRSLQRVI